MRFLAAGENFLRLRAGAFGVAASAGPPGRRERSSAIFVSILLLRLEAKNGGGNDFVREFLVAFQLSYQLRSAFHGHDGVIVGVW